MRTHLVIGVVALGLLVFVVGSSGATGLSSGDAAASLHIPPAAASPFSPSASAPDRARSALPSSSPGAEQWQAPTPRAPLTNTESAVSSQEVLYVEVVPPIGPAFDVHHSIAADTQALLDAAEADGILLGGSGLRSHQRQHKLRELNGCGRWVNGQLVDDGSWTHSDDENYRDWVPAKACRTPTARPGRSNHEVAKAIDFTIPHPGADPPWRVIPHRGHPAFNWLTSHAWRYGLKNLPSEPWHWSVDGR